ncbi:NAD(P)-dependent oxidoreductase [Burkholderia sp. Nafp2/4-1b]|uniref:NmrA family NAD(P)-binding protein n=1 Tax=Burkholderia sp. Nafp2/4-1b TaxID=2116686 RepID=UPI000EF9134C|nr:NAD(P)H-binding protein [Burkholderia sp. Nafp2/4-1b]RKU00166.1 NAD(P)-dependent oxidoreductase [Burkholderia sp. Nafp2/4-1b]
MTVGSPVTSQRPRIAIAGATGRVGSSLISLLVSESVDVVALTRTPDALDLPPGVNAAGVDFSEPRTLVDALRGTERLFVSHGTSLQQVANEVALIDAAVASGVRHIVKLSSFGPPTRLNPMAWHMQIEAHLARQAVASTTLRPSTFMDVLKRSAAAIASDSWAGAAGNGRVNFIDTRDVARVACIALLEQVEPESQRVYHLTGPHVMTMHEIADELSRLLGRNVIYAERTLEQQREVLLAEGSPAYVADLLVGLDQLFRDSAMSEITTTVQEVTGEAPLPVTQWLAENISIFEK